MTKNTGSKYAGWSNKATYELKDVLDTALVSLSGLQRELRGIITDSNNPFVVKDYLEDVVFELGIFIEPEADLLEISNYYIDLYSRKGL